MRVSIVVDDGLVYVDGVARRVDVSDLELPVRAVHWNGDTGHLEFDHAIGWELPLDGFSEFERYVQRWIEVVNDTTTVVM
jgi:hypothetical protein